MIVVNQVREITAISVVVLSRFRILGKKNSHYFLIIVYINRRPCQ